MTISWHLPARILKAYIKALTGFSHIFSPDGLHHHYYLSKTENFLEGMCGNSKETGTLIGKFEFFQHTKIGRHLCRILDQSGLRYIFEEHCDL